MHWVSEKEEWLSEWSDAHCLGEISFLPADASPGLRQATQIQEETADVFFSQIIEARGRSLVCRAMGRVVDIFDISPTAESLVSWRVLLPEVVLPDIGICSACDDAETALSIMFLTKAYTIHTVDVMLPGVSGSTSLRPDVRLGVTVASKLSASPSAFCAVSPDLAVVGCFSGAMHAVRLKGGLPSYEFVDASILRRLVGGLIRPSLPAVLAIAVAGVGARGMQLLSFTADGRVMLWEASERCGTLLASTSIDQDQQAPAFVNAQSPYIRVARRTEMAGRTTACLMQRGVLFLVDIVGEGLRVRQLAPPFAAASPLLVSLTAGALWGFWSGGSRDQLFRIDLEDRDSLAWQARALDASLVQVDDRPQVRRAATEGCVAVAGTQPAHRAVFTLYQQREVWRCDEEAFDALHATTPCEAGEDAHEACERAVRWWTARVLLPGRFPRSVVAAALKESGARPIVAAGGAVGGSPVTTDEQPCALRAAIEVHFRRQSGVHGSASVASHFQISGALATAALDFLRLCAGLSRQKRQVCGMGVSALWAPHVWYPAGSMIAGAGDEGGSRACPLLLYHGGVSCIRPVHTWSERWWATCHLSRDLSNYEKIEIENLLELSELLEWKICVTSWFLAQCARPANLGLALGTAKPQAHPSRTIHRFLQDLPSDMVAHVQRCSRWITSPTLGDDVETLMQLLQTSFCPEQFEANVFGQRFDALRGTWLRQPHGAGQLVLSDLLRGSIAVGESEHACTAMRDLLLLCGHLAGEQTHEAEMPQWGDLGALLDTQLPVMASLRSSLPFELPSKPGAVQQLPARACDVWVSVYRASVEGRYVAMRAPAASFHALNYGLHLLRHECWGALREWCAHQDLPALQSYVAAREWLATGRLDAARLGFEQAEGIAGTLMECLGAGEAAGLQLSAGPTDVAYFEHVARLFEERGLHQDAFTYLSKAASLAEEGEASAELRQKLWPAVFDKAVELDMVTEACDALVHIDRFEGYLHALALKLRSSCRIDLVMQLPEKHKACFINNLHEHALLSDPAAGTDSLLCYQHLYALHFSAQEYMKAAIIAHALLCALGTALRRVMPAARRDEDCLTVLDKIRAGDCISQAQDVPKKPKVTEALAVAAEQDAPMDGDAEVGRYVWMLLDQQRGALLLLNSALALTDEKVLVVPPSSQRRAPNTAWTAPMTGGATGVLAMEAAARECSPSSDQAPAEALVTLPTVEARLAKTEALLLLCGHDEDGRASCEEPAVAAAAKRVAELGLLSLALRVAQTHGLDLWHCAFQPFLGLCLKADAADDGAAAAVVAAARGPALAHMFVRSDAAEPLGTAGDARAAWWQTLEHSLAATHAADAAGHRLYSLVAEEWLSKRPTEALPGFVEAALSCGPSWVCLLRLYMKFRRFEDAIDLLVATSKRCESGPVFSTTPGRKWSPLQDFPVTAVVQLQRAMGQQVAKDGAGKLAQRSAELNGVIALFQSLLATGAQ